MHNKKLFMISLLTSIYLLSGCGSSSSSTTNSEEFYSNVPAISFRVTVPIDIEETATIKIAGNFNGWNPLDEDYVLEKHDHRQYRIVITFTEEDVGTTLQYKYVLLFSDQTTTNMWANVEGGPQAQEIADRTYTLKSGGQIVNDSVQSFKNNMGKDTITRGTLETFSLAMPQYDDNRQRTVRVWLPDGYDKNNTTKKYPVLYMHDGQNLFDQYTAFAGEWKIDETIGSLMDNGYNGTIVVGIDNSYDRLNEYSPNAFPLNSSGTSNISNPSGEKYGSFIVDTLKPYIDTHYNTNPSKQTTGIGGSSMGSVISFYMVLAYKNVFGYGLLFSTSMWLYETNTSENFINSINYDSVDELPKIYVYVGGAETSITRYVNDIKTALLAKGWTEGMVKTHTTATANHNESAWAAHFPIAYSWLVGIS